MAATARPLLPFDPALAGSAQLSIPLNDNALRAEAQGRAAVGFQASQPSLTSPADDGKLYILSAAWGDEVVDTIALFRAGSWSYWTPYDGLIKRVGASVFYQFNGATSDWEVYAPSSTAPPALQFLSDTASTTDADPGAGNLRWNNATQASATQLFVDDSTVDAISVTSVWTWAGATGMIFLQSAGDKDTWQAWQYTASTSGTGYRKFTVTLLANGGTFVDNDPLRVTLTPTGAGGGGSTQGRHAIYISAAGMRPSVTGGCAGLTAIASAANQPDIVTLDFDATTQEYAQFGLVMPKKWNEGTVTFIPHWSHATTTVNFGVVWDLQAVAVSNDDPIAVAYGTAQTSTDTGGTTNDLYAGPESAAITVGGTPQPEDMVFFRLSRVTSNGSDTMAIDARLHGITLYVTTNADTDA